MVARALAREAQVVALTSAREALALLGRGERFDRILCDLMMPGMSGPELHAELARRHPELLPRLTFMTGGAFTEGARGFVESWRGPILEKPIDHLALRRLIHERPT
jgi:CheY-like chemotaxis protein